MFLICIIVINGIEQHHFVCFSISNDEHVHPYTMGANFLVNFVVRLCSSQSTYGICMSMFERTNLIFLDINYDKLNCAYI